MRKETVHRCGKVTFKRIVAKMGFVGSLKTNLQGFFNNEDTNCRRRLRGTEKRTLTRLRRHTNTVKTGTIVNISVSCRILNTSGKVLVMATDKATMIISWNL